MSVGGSIESLTLDGRTFSVAADADTTRNLGGTDNEVEMNGDGTYRIVKTRVAAKIDGITVAIDDAREDAEYLQELKDRKEGFPYSITYASGEIYQGTGTIVGETGISSQNATASITISGSALTKQ